MILQPPFTYFSSALAHLLHCLLIFLLEYFVTEANPNLERMEEAISSLKNDKDPDVRAYFNPPPSLSTCESTTEYFDSDGEPIGDVSVSDK